MRVGDNAADLTGPPERLREFGPSAATVVVSSRLGAERGSVWARVISPAGIRDEMWPLMRMTFPRGVQSIDEVEVGVPVGRSWLLLGGVVPFDYDDLMLARLDPGEAFTERSFMASMRLWEHLRTLADIPGGGCRVTDALTFEPRLGLPGRFARPVIRAIFDHRHRRLRRRFGVAP